MHKGDHKSGFLIKKDSKIFKKINISKFDFLDLYGKEQLLSDNPSTNIIHKDLHEEKRTFVITFMHNYLPCVVLRRSRIASVVAQVHCELKQNLFFYLACFRFVVVLCRTWIVLR